MVNSSKITVISLNKTCLEGVPNCLDHILNAKNPGCWQSDFKIKEYAKKVQLLAPADAIWQWVGLCSKAPPKGKIKQPQSADIFQPDPTKETASIFKSEIPNAHSDHFSLKDWLFVKVTCSCKNPPP